MRKEVVLNYRGIRFMIPKQSECFWPYYGICFVGEYNQLLDNIRKEDTVLDAGANVGIFSLLASQKCSRVLAVEPDPLNYFYLVKNIELNKAENIIPINSALSDYIGSGFISGRGLSAALSQCGIPITVTTIDKLLEDLKLGKIDVVKMDIEGSEVKAINGRYLQTVRELIVESHSKSGYSVVCEILGREAFRITEWSLSYFRVLKRIIENLTDFVSSELKTGFVASKLLFNYIFGLSGHPVPAANKESEIKLIYAKHG